jgi:hypothetical protein
MEPSRKLHSSGFWLEFPYDQAYLRMVKQGSSEATEQVTEQVTVLLAQINGEMTRQALQHALDLAHREHFRSSYLLPAPAAGLIEMTLSDKPNRRLQKYRLTATGRRIFQAQQPGGSGSSRGVHS